MAHWIFRCNTDWFKLEERLAAFKSAGLKPGSWRVNRHKKDIHTGDVAFIWRTQKPTAPGGIRAICSIDSEPDERGDVAADIPYVIEPDEGKCQVLLTYTDEVWVPEDDIRAALPKLSVLMRPWDGTNFDMTEHQAAVILKMANKA